MTTRKKAQQNEGQANFLLEMFFIFSTALATEDPKPTFNINEASTLELKKANSKYPTKEEDKV